MRKKLADEIKTALFVWVECVKVGAAFGALYGVVYGTLFGAMSVTGGIGGALLGSLSGALQGTLIGAVLGAIFGTAAGLLTGGIVVAGLAADSVTRSISPVRRAARCGAPLEVAPADIPIGRGSEASPHADL
jgi:hypothetical protein